MKVETLDETCNRWEKVIVQLSTDPPKKFDLVQLWALSNEQNNKLLAQQQNTPTLAAAEAKEVEDFTKAKDEKEAEDLTKAKEIQTKVLRAVAGCRTIEQLLIRDASFGRYGTGFNVFEPIEWELFFTKLLSNTVLRSVIIEGSSSFYDSILPPFTSYLANSVTLENLRIGELLRDAQVIPKRRIRRLGAATVEKLSEALVQSKTLEFLQIGCVEVANIHILLKAFTAYPRNQSLQVLEIDEYIGWLGYALPSLLSCEHSSLKEIRLNVLTCTELDVEQTSAIGCALHMATSLERFTLVTDLRSPVDRKLTYNVQDAIDVMDELVKASRGSSALKLDICILRDYMNSELSDWLVRALSRYSNVDRLQLKSLRGGSFELHELLPIFEAVKSTFFLQNLSVKNIKGAVAWKHLAECLQSNSSLRRLTYEDSSDLDETSFKCLMELLQVNINLEEIDFGSSSWSSDGRVALAREALKRNKTLKTNLETLGGAGLSLNGPRSGRLFLCGSPNAGKTRLRATMMKTRNKKSWLKKVVGGSKKKGVEVELLRDDEEMQVSIWDLAGQWIFRALEDLIFPRASQTCLFVFIFNPLEDNGEKVKPDLGQALRTQLTSWLRFVASNSQVTGHCLPHVMVVVTHRDKMVNQESGWAKFIVNDLQEKFDGVINLLGGDELYFIDAQSTKDVQPMTEKILRLFQESLRQKSPVVPLACAQLSSKLAKRPLEVINCPVWHIDTLYSFFSQELKVLQAKSFDLRVKSERKILEAIALYMHDSGSIVMVPETEMVVVDVNWLMDKFLGRLICQGHNSDFKDGSIHLSPDGFVADFELQDILLKLWTKHRRQGITFDIRILEDLLVKLDLCYHSINRKGEGRFFAPSLFGKDESKQRVTDAGQFSLEWTNSDPNQWGFLGFRLQCQDKERTVLTPAVFPRFQIHLRNKIKGMGVEMVQENFDCSHDYTRLHVNGYYIIVERSGHLRDSVDILVRYPKFKRREKAAAMAFVKQSLVEGFRAYSASPKGCPGVALVVAFIRAECVRKLTPHLHRVSNQVVVVEDLKKQFTEDVEKKLEVVELDGQQWGEDNFLLDYQHPWPRVPHPQANLLNHSELALELLERKDVEDVVKTVRSRREERIENLKTLVEDLDASIVTNESLKSEKDKSGLQTTTVTSGTNSPAGEEEVLEDEKNGSEVDRDSHLSERDAELLNLITSMVDKKRGISDGDFGSFEELERHSIRRDLARIISIQRELRAHLTLMMSKVDKMIGYTDALKKAKMPRRPFLTLDDMGFGKRLGAAVQFGTPVRLHLMCESHAGPHVIERQPGWGVCVTKENKEWLRLISVNSLTIAWFLLKSGVQLVVPSHPGPGPVKEVEFSELGVGMKGALTVTDVTVETLKNRDNMRLAPGDEMTSEAWTFLKNCMAAKLDYAQDFRLHLVKYKATPGSVNESHAWLCQSCITRGQQNGILSKVGQQDHASN
ncbi:hypothetical protein R1sor_013010 [Riccia sorocarpa]|uniref:C-terminal of Roc (COR) domain-containing protein n=1 Tax=Riccia sorocarpa TaxID=122646 RepID=A0ABD3H7B2_9MARC